MDIALQNLAVGYIVLISGENSPRNKWPLCRVVEVLLDRKGLVRRAKGKVKRAVVERPIDKLCLLWRLELFRRNDFRVFHDCI